MSENKILLQVPYFKNDKNGNQCMQVAMRSVINYFLDKDISLDELDELTGRKGSYWTWTSQVVVALHKLGLKVKYYSKSDLQPFAQGASYIRNYFGKDAQNIIANSDINTVVKSIKETLKLGLFEKKLITIADITNALTNEVIPLVVVDHNVLSKAQGPYAGHMVVVTGFDDKNIYFHESGPDKDMRPNKTVSKDLFNRAFSASGTDNDIVFVYEPRKGLVD